MKKRVQLLVLALIVSQLLGFNFTYADSKLKIGDVVSFGEITYYVTDGTTGEYIIEPLLWEIINFDSDGDPLLFADSILAYQAFDASESGKFGVVLENPYTTDENRSRYGSNRWINSNIREWLNDSINSLVSFSTQPPDFFAVSDEMDYDGSMAFIRMLKNGDAIKSITHETKLTYVDEGESEAATDKIFLLSADEFVEYIIGNGLEPNRKPLELIYEQDATSWLKEKVESTNSWRYWLRTPDEYNSHEVFYVHENNTSNDVEDYVSFQSEFASISYMGICPAFYVDLSKVDLEVVRKSVVDVNEDSKVNGVNISSASSWALTEINDAVAKNLTTANSTDNFKEFITREEFCEVIMKLYDAIGGKAIAETSNSFNDTDNPEIIRAYHAGIIGGTSATTFSPTENLTREQLCVMIVRALDASEVNYIYDMDYQESYPDIINISSWATTGVKILNGYKILNGTGGGLVPNGTVTKEVAIVLINRTFDRFK